MMPHYTGASGPGVPRVWHVGSGDGWRARVAAVGPHPADADIIW
jgi:hypothetical protein